MFKLTSACPSAVDEPCCVQIQSLLGTLSLVWSEIDCGGPTRYPRIAPDSPITSGLWWSVHACWCSLWAYELRKEVTPYNVGINDCYGIAVLVDTEG